MKSIPTSTTGGFKIYSATTEGSSDLGSEDRGQAARGITPKMSCGNPILRIAGMSHQYGDNPVLHDISLDVVENEFLTILGPSGSGKSTLLRVIAGLEFPQAVEVMQLAGNDVIGVPANRRNVSTVFQHHALFPHMSVGENVEYGLRLRGIKPEQRRVRASMMLDLVRLADKYNVSVQHLSGGERQRVAIARSLAIEPEILLLDEPLGSLDEKLRGEMQLELIQLRKNTGKTFILVTHSQEEAITMSDRIVLMRSGRFEQIGSPSDLFDHPQTLFAARFMGVENIIEGKLESIDSEYATIETASAQLTGRALPSLTSSRPGDRAFLAARAENIRIVKPSQLAQNTLRGTITAPVYKGRYRDVPVQTQAGVLIVRQWDETHLTHEVTVTLMPDKCVVGSAAS